MSPAAPLHDLAPEELATACRRAYLRAVVGAEAGWGKRELAQWLAGTYRSLVSRDSVPPPSSSGGGVSDERVAALLEVMHADVMLVLRELVTPEGLSAFTSLAVDTELVARAAGDGMPWVPRARARMTLADRVLSLVAVDVLTRPEDFEHSLFVCARCGQPRFDVAQRPVGVCRVHVSGVRAVDG